MQNVNESLCITFTNITYSLLLTFLQFLVYPQLQFTHEQAQEQSDEKYESKGNQEEIDENH